jgi:replicative DNA helicase
MVDNAALDDAGLTGDDFYHNANRTIWDAIGELSSHGKPFDMVSVMLRLQDTGRLDAVGGPEYLGAIINGTAGSRNIKTYAAAVKDKSTRRKLASAGAEIMRLAMDAGSSGEAMDKAQAILMGLVDTTDKRGPVDIKQLLSPYIDVIDERFKRRGGFVGLPTGFSDIDKRTGGLVGGQLIIIAGRPSMGKTTFALNIAENVALTDKTVMTFSMEMGANELLDKHYASIGSVLLESLRTGKLDDSEFNRITTTTHKLLKANMVIDDSPNLTIGEVISRARKIKRQRGLALVVVDYLQLMRGDSKSRVEEISAISRGMKLMAKELDVPVIALSQLNRELEKRQNKRPMMSDLRESGAIEQDADIIMMLYRDEVYNESTDRKGIAECIFTQHRNGQTGMDGLLFDGAFSRFRSFEGMMPEPKEEKQTWRGGFDE